MIDFIGKKKLFLCISTAMVALALICAMIFGVNLDIQFKGGAIMTYSFEGELSKDAFRSTFKEVLGQDVSVQEQTDVVTGKKNYVASTATPEGINSDKQLAIKEALVKNFPDNNIESVSMSVVDPTIGKEFLSKCMVAISFAAVLMILYVAFRFQKIGGLSAGVVSVVALIHDIFAVFATFIIFRIPINDNFIAVALTILGYSLNDTIVIYDRIRENKRLFGSKLSLGELVNKSINQSLTRSLTTTITTVLSMVVVSVVAYIYNVDSILSFSFPLIIGMISGSYSSICVAPPLWVMWEERKAAAKK